MQRLIHTLILVLLMSGPAAAQGGLQESLFTEVDQLFEKAKAEKAEIYAPENFSAALRYYESAQKSFEKARSIQEIRKNIERTAGHLQDAIRYADVAKLNFASTIESREAASSAEASEYARELWSSAEKSFNAAMIRMESDDLKGAQRRAADAEESYRAAELKAIKVAILGPAKELLLEAERIKAANYAPESFNRARQSVYDVDNMLSKNRYAQDEGTALAKEAKYQAQHSILLTHRIKELQKERHVLERLLLEGETNLDLIASSLNLSLNFNQDNQTNIETILLAIDDLQHAKQELQARKAEIAILNEQLDSMQARLGQYSKSEKELQQKIALKRAQEQTVQNIASTFSRSEAQVLIDGNNVIIRLYGLSFPVGTSEIKPEYFELLKRVQRGILEFKNAEVTIEGHTDSRGSAQLNQRLSNQRAEAVRTYLLANMSFPAAKMQAVGFGETKPVANNENEQGRAKNRRIDITIVPEWAQ